jgi:hypothetical protein
VDNDNRAMFLALRERASGITRTQIIVNKAAYAGSLNHAFIPADDAMHSLRSIVHGSRFGRGSSTRCSGV